MERRNEMVRKEHRKQIAELSRTKTVNELAREFRINRCTVRQIQRENGIEDWKHGKMITVMELREKRKTHICEWCHLRECTQRHHALIRRDKRFPELDDEKNLILVCPHCHMSGEVDSKEARKIFWTRLCERYTEFAMLDWLESLPLKIKQWEFIS